MPAERGDLEFHQASGRLCLGRKPFLDFESETIHYLHGHAFMGFRVLPHVLKPWRLVFPLELKA